MATVHGSGMPLRAGFGAVAAVVIAVVVAGGSVATAHSTSCNAGVRQLNGVPARTFCGPAAARIRIGGKTFVFAEGNCVATQQFVSINIGTVVLGQTTRHQPNYFGLDIGRIPGSGSPPARQDGSYRSGTVLTVEYADKSYDVVSGVATLQGHRSRGTIRGNTFSGQALTGTFHC